MKPIKIVVADDDAFWIEGLRALTDDHADIEVVGTTVYLREVEDLVQQFSPDVVVLDVAWPGDKSAGIKQLTQLKARHDIQAVAITAYPELVELAQAAGAFTLKKGFSLEQLIDTIWQAAQGQADLTTPTAPAESLGEDITERELEVLQEIARGATDRQIAAKLSITEGTVKKHVSSILSKLDAKNRAEAAVIAIRRNLLD